MAEAAHGSVADWHVRGSYFEACNCEAICPCRSVGGRPGGPSSFGECFGTLSWHIHHGHADGIDLSDLRTVMSLRYFDRVQPSTPWEVVLYVDQSADTAQHAAIADIFLGRAGGTVARQYGPAIGQVLAVRPARITIEHTAPRKRIGVVGYLNVDAEGEASDPGDVRCGIPGFDHPGTELYGDTLISTDPALLTMATRQRGAVRFAITNRATRCASLVNLSRRLAPGVRVRLPGFSRAIRSTSPARTSSIGGPSGRFG